MDLKTYLNSERGRQASLAKAIGAHAPDISRWADGKRPIPLCYGGPIEVATEGRVTRQEMFPETWARHWPELAVTSTRRATDRKPLRGRAGRQPPSPHNILDTVPECGVVSAIPTSKD